MPTCPLCESTQPAGEACDVCGRPFPPGVAVPLPTPTLPELELTHHAPAGDGARIPALPELEPTAQQEGLPGAPGAAGERVDGFDPTAAEPVDVAVIPLEVERVGDDALLDLPPEPAGPVACRYCRTPARPEDRICGRCGMRLPLARTPGVRRVSAPEPCRECGIPMSGPQCQACGARRGTLR
jgi:hypothetical protein